MEKGNIVSINEIKNIIRIPWKIVDYQINILNELNLKLKDNQIFSGEKIEIIAERCDCNDILVYFPDYFTCCIFQLSGNNIDWFNLKPDLIYSFDALKDIIEEDYIKYNM